MKGKFACSCGRHLALEMMQHATNVVQRTCPKCRSKWQIVITPTYSKGDVFIHTLQATKLQGTK
jgi:hypothetical protein